MSEELVVRVFPARHGRESALIQPSRGPIRDLGVEPGDAQIISQTVLELVEMISTSSEWPVKVFVDTIGCGASIADMLRASAENGDSIEVVDAPVFKGGLRPNETPAEVSSATDLFDVVDYGAGYLDMSTHEEVRVVVKPARPGRTRLTTYRTNGTSGTLYLTKTELAALIAGLSVQMEAM